MKSLLAEIRMSLITGAALAVLLCGAYPLLVWIVAQVCFPYQANGSLILRQGTVEGSRLIAQPFSGSEYFHPRPSAAGQGYDAAASGGSNLGPLSRTLIDQVTERLAHVRTENNVAANIPIPADAVTASGSGLDPHISLAYALLQAPRIARARGIPEDAVRKKIDQFTENRSFRFLGEPRVNVLMINLALNENQ